MSRNLKIMLIHLIASIILFTSAFTIIKTGIESEECIKQLKQSNIEITQECEVYRNRSQEYENRCLKLENIIEGCGLVVDNCECR